MERGPEANVEQPLIQQQTQPLQDLIVDPNLAARNFWLPLEHAELSATIPYPRQFARSSENEMTTKSRAPLIGEHNGEIYGELGLSAENIAELKQSGVI